LGKSGHTILDFRFWILDWGMPCQLKVSEIEVMQVQTKKYLCPNRFGGGYISLWYNNLLQSPKTSSSSL
jgi:hypothetical protein